MNLDSGKRNKIEKNRREVMHLMVSRDNELMSAVVWLRQDVEVLAGSGERQDNEVICVSKLQSPIRQRCWRRSPFSFPNMYEH